MSLASFLIIFLSDALTYLTFLFMSLVYHRSQIGYSAGLIAAAQQFEIPRRAERNLLLDYPA
jgi:hypothetical protein